MSASPKVLQNRWENNHARQFNWGLDHAPIAGDWVMRLDADEYVTPELAEEIKRRLSALSADVSGIYFNMGIWYHHYQPSWYCQFLDNEILEGNVYRSGSNNSLLSGEAVIGTIGGQKPPNTAPLALATIHRRNHLHSNAHLDLNGGNNRAAPGIRDVIMENNSVENADVGLSISAGVVGVLEQGNTFTNVKEPERKPANE